jgi:hypothetical protein
MRDEAGSGVVDEKTAEYCKSTAEYINTPFTESHAEKGLS